MPEIEFAQDTLEYVRLFLKKIPQEWVSGLGRLRGMRRTADYDLSSPVRRRDVNHAFALLTQLATEFEQALEVG